MSTVSYVTTHECKGDSIECRAAMSINDPFSALFDHIPLPLFLIRLGDSSPTIICGNQAAETLFGYDAVDFQEMTLVHIVPTSSMSDVKHFLIECGRQSVSALDTVCQRQDGTLFPARMTTLPVSTAGLVIAMEDRSILRLLRSETEAIDAERRRIAHEIHDGVVQDLAALRFDTALWHTLIERTPEQMHAKVENLRDILNQSILGLRRAIFSLRPLELETVGFFPAVRRFAGEFGDQNQIAVIIEIVGNEDDLPKAFELPLFRVIQEALHNVGKHAQATFVTIEFDIAATKPAVSLRIKDNGCGFDPAASYHTNTHEHYGLQQMRERVEAESGMLTIQSQNGIGTELLVELPNYREDRR